MKALTIADYRLTCSSTIAQNVRSRSAKLPRSSVAACPSGVSHALSIASRVRHHNSTTASHPGSPSGRIFNDVVLPVCHRPMHVLQIRQKPRAREVPASIENDLTKLGAKIPANSTDADNANVHICPNSIARNAAWSCTQTTRDRYAALGVRFRDLSRFRAGVNSFLRSALKQYYLSAFPGGVSPRPG